MNFQVEQFRQLPCRPNVVWQGDITKMPLWITEETPAPFRPVSAIWVDAVTGLVNNGEPLHPDKAHPEVLLQCLFDFAANKTLAGYRPGILEVLDAELADFLRERLAGLNIQVRIRTRLYWLDEVLASLFEYFKAPDISGPLSVKGVTLDMMRAFAEAGADFWRAEPWRYFSDEDLIEIEAPFADSQTRYMTVMGHGGQTFGLSFFASRDQYNKLHTTDPKDYFIHNSVWSVMFDPITSLPFPDVDLWLDHNLPVADEEGYPYAMLCAAGKKPRRPGPELLAFFEGLLRIFAQVSEEQLDAGRWSATVPTCKGPLTFTLALPELLAYLENPSAAPVADIPRRFDRRAMEQSMVGLQKLIDEQNLDDIDEINEFIQNNINTGKVSAPEPRTPLEKAQNLVYRAFEARGRIQILMARKALEICPDCTDAYVLLAERTTNAQKAYDLYLEGMLAGERTLGTEYFIENKGHFWGILETRPYMRARLGLAQTLEDLDRREEACQHYRELLRLNPHDNQGARELLMPTLLHLDADDELEELLARYEDKHMALWSYTRALLSYRQMSDKPIARKHLKHALKVNLHVADMLLGYDDDEYSLGEGYTLGSPEEAAMCTGLLADAWTDTPGASDWLEKHYPA
ncbi:MAG: hypothetical protein JW709_00895 [Sedimentisphaerales bacterium]|nr:hypothetical protein [Sedimentisphaerales bacterium]